MRKRAKAAGRKITRVIKQRAPKLARARGAKRRNHVSA